MTDVVTDVVKGDGFNILNGLFLPEGPAFPVFLSFQRVWTLGRPKTRSHLRMPFAVRSLWRWRFFITPAQQKGVAPLYRKVGIAQVAPYHHMEEWYFFPKEMKAYHQWYKLVSPMIQTHITSDTNSYHQWYKLISPVIQTRITSDTTWIPLQFGQNSHSSFSILHSPPWREALGWILPYSGLSG